MKNSKKLLKAKGLKDTLYDTTKNDGSWIKGGLSALLDEYAESEVKNFSFNLSVSGQFCVCSKPNFITRNDGIEECGNCGRPQTQNFR